MQLEKYYSFTLHLDSRKSHVHCHPLGRQESDQCVDVTTAASAGKGASSDTAVSKQPHDSFTGAFAAGHSPNATILMYSSTCCQRGAQVQPCWCRCRYGLAPHTTPRLSAFVDKEQQHANVQITFNHSRGQISTPAAFFTFLQDGMFQAAVNNRFYKLCRRPDPPFWAAQVTLPLRLNLDKCLLLVVPLLGVCSSRRLQRFYSLQAFLCLVSVGTVQNTHMASSSAVSVISHPL